MGGIFASAPLCRVYPQNYKPQKMRLTNHPTYAILNPWIGGETIAATFEAVPEDDDANLNELANSITATFVEREKTYRSMIALYEKLLDNLIPKNPEVDDVKWSAIQKLAEVAYNNDDFASERAEMLDSIRMILKENK